MFAPASKKNYTILEEDTTPIGASPLPHGVY